MSKYAPLWEYIKNEDKDSLLLTFDEIGRIIEGEFDHSFLTYKKELIEYGFHVKKISIKGETVIFVRND